MSLIPYVKNNDWTALRQALAKLASLKLGGNASPTFSGLTLTGLTQGSVLFASAGGLISQDNSNLFWDATNNRLGVGTSGPLDILHIKTSSSTVSMFLENTAVDGNCTYRIKNDAVQFEFLLRGDQSDLFRWWNGSVYTMSMDQSGNTIIGPGQSPKTRLTVEGAFTLLEQAAADGNNAGYGQLWVKTATPNELWFTDDIGTELRVAPQDLQITASPTFDGLTSTSQIALNSVGANIITATNANGDLRLGAGGGTNDLKIDINGNVDIFENLTIGGKADIDEDITINPTQVNSAFGLNLLTLASGPPDSKAPGFIFFDGQADFYVFSSTRNAQAIGANTLAVSTTKPAFANHASIWTLKDNGNVCSDGDREVIDNKKFICGTSSDSSIFWNGSDLIINSENVTAADEIHFTNFTAYVFDAPLQLTQHAGVTVDGSIWNDSTQKALQTSVSGIEQSLMGCIFTQTADQTIADTVTETTMFGTGVGTLTLPANFWTVSKVPEPPIERHVITT